MLNRQLEHAVAIINRGGIIAYPTEAVYGLGCDPHNHSALQRLLHLKRRPADKGLVVVAANIEQILTMVQPLSENEQATITASYAHPISWLIPAMATVNPLVTGNSSKIAVRICQHPLVQQLTLEFGGPIVSTSANLSGKLPATTAEQVRTAFTDTIDLILEGEVGGSSAPSEIKDLADGSMIRSHPA